MHEAQSPGASGGLVGLKAAWDAAKLAGLWRALGSAGRVFAGLLGWGAGVVAGVAERLCPGGCCLLIVALLG